MGLLNRIESGMSWLYDHMPARDSRFVKVGASGLMLAVGPYMVKGDTFNVIGACGSNPEIDCQDYNAVSQDKKELKWNAKAKYNDGSALFEVWLRDIYSTTKPLITNISDMDWSSDDPTVNPTSPNLWTVHLSNPSGSSSGEPIDIEVHTFRSSKYRQVDIQSKIAQGHVEPGGEPSDIFQFSAGEKPLFSVLPIETPIIINDTRLDWNYKITNTSENSETEFHLYGILSNQAPTVTISGWTVPAAQFISGQGWKVDLTNGSLAKNADLLFTLSTYIPNRFTSQGLESKTAETRIESSTLPETYQAPSQYFFIFDLNKDGNIGSDDTTAFQNCASGPAIPATPECKTNYDFDNDNDVDQDDFGAFQRCISGDQPYDPACLQTSTFNTNQQYKVELKTKLPSLVTRTC